MQRRARSFNSRRVRRQDREALRDGGLETLRAGRDQADLAEYLHLVPKVPEFLRTAMELRLTTQDFEELIEQIKRKRTESA